MHVGLLRAAGALGGSWMLLACSPPPDIVATQPRTLELSGDIEVHDPSVVESAGTFYLFSSGPGIATKTSLDLHAWRNGPSVFDANPAWIATLVPDATDLWSPTVRFFGGAFHLYYAASTFGSGRSCVGHATRASLAGSEPWADQGPVVCSNTTATSDDFNAIDPEVLIAEDATPWLVFGSFRSGIKLSQLTSAGVLATSDLISVAARPNNGAIQAAALVQHAGYSYLFTSFDICCMGVDSTHRIMVGRATSPEGPYVDRFGAPLLDGAGTLVLAGDARFRGPGSNAILLSQDRYLNVYHAYDADNAGVATLRIAELVWNEQGWPISGGP